jgi:hypothetical protein
MDVVTTNELGLAGVDDETQVRKAAELGRVLITNNISDFVPLHTRWLTEGRSPHSGIVVFGQQTLSIGETIRRIASLTRTRTSEEMSNRLEWLSSWG